jgi:hypothetical protein
MSEVDKSVPTPQSEETPVIGEEIMEEYLKHCLTSSTLRDNPKDALEDLIKFNDEFFGVKDLLSFEQKKRFLKLYNKKKGGFNFCSIKIIITLELKKRLVQSNESQSVGKKEKAGRKTGSLFFMSFKIFPRR